MKSDNTGNAYRVVTVAAATLMVAAVILDTWTRPPDTDTVWISEHLTAMEIRQVRHLAARISHLAKQSRHDIKLSEAVRSLSIREAAALGLLLLRTLDEEDTASWLRLPAEREQQATIHLKHLLSRFGSSAPWHPPMATTIRGTERLRTICGDELLTEVTAVGFQTVDDSGITIPSNFIDEDLRLLLRLPGLERIWIDSAPITDEGVALLASLQRLQEIHLFHCPQLTDKSLQMLVSPRLLSLNLTGISQVSDAGVQSLVRCPNLQELVLDGTGISSASLPVIADCRQLTKLNISRTKVCEGLDQLDSLKRLEDLGIAGLGSSDQPVPWKSLHFLIACRHLASLDLEGTALHRLELRSLPCLSQLAVGHSRLKEIFMSDLPQLQRLDLSRPSMEFSELTIGGLPNLRYLTISGMDESASKGLARGLKDLTQLAYLKLRSSPLTDDLADAIGQLPRLQLLDVGDSSMTTRQREFILKSRHLQNLHCRGDLLGIEDWHAFGRSNLTDLTVSRLRLDDLNQSLPFSSLKVLKLEDCSIGHLALKELPTLTDIDFRLGQIDNLNIVKCPRLRSCTLMQIGIENLRIDSCLRLENVTGLYESRFGRMTLSDLPQLERIVVQERSSVQELNLSRLPRLSSASFWLGEISTRALQELIDVPSITALDVSSTSLGDDAAIVISRMAGLEKLSASPHFTRRGLEHLRNLPHLNELNLYHRTEADWSQEEVPRLLPNVRYYCVFEHF